MVERIEDQGLIGNAGGIRIPQACPADRYALWLIEAGARRTVVVRQSLRHHDTYQSQLLISYFRRVERFLLRMISRHACCIRHEHGEWKIGTT